MRGKDSRLSRAGHPLDGSDPDNRRHDRVFEPVIGLAEIFLHGFAIEAAGDLLGGGDLELVANDLGQSATLELVLEQLALGFRALQDGVGTATNQMLSAWAMVRSIAWVRAGAEVAASRRLVFVITLIHGEVN
jgi:hypothetical protein